MIRLLPLVLFIVFLITIIGCHSNKVDRHHYKNFYLKKMNKENIKRKGNIWNSPYYELQKKNYENDQKIHREVLRESQQHNAEYKKQYDESVNERKETQRMQDETRRENSVKQAEKSNNGTQRSMLGLKNRKDLKELTMTHEDSNAFLKTKKKKHYF